MITATFIYYYYFDCINAKSEVRFKQLIRGAFTIDSSTPTLTGKFK
jgi:hypothetical protein